MENIMAPQRCYNMPDGYDSASNYQITDGESSGQSLQPHPFLLPFEEFEGEMTQIQEYYGGEETQPWHAVSAESPNEIASSHSDEVAKSPGPGRHGHGGLHVLAEGSCQSMSPSGTSNILTPTSTLDYHDGSAYGDQESEPNGVSPTRRLEMESSPIDDLVLTSDSELSGGQGRRMSTQPPRSGAHFHLSGNPSRRSRESSTSQQSSTQSAPGQPWTMNSFNSSATVDDTYIAFDSSVDLVYPAFTDAEQHPSHADGFTGHSFSNQSYGQLPFRPHDDVAQLVTQYGDQPQLPQQQSFQQHAPGAFDQTFGPHFSNNDDNNNNNSNSNNNSFNYAHLHPNAMTGMSFAYNPQQVNQRYQQHVIQQPSMRPAQHRPPMPASLDTAMRPTRNSAGLAMGRSQLYPPQQQQQQRQQQYQRRSNVGPVSLLDEKPIKAPSPTQSKAGSDGGSAATIPAKRPLLQKPEAGAVRTPPQSGVRKGGRPKHSHLSDSSRLRSHNMRKVGACWRCVLQRDSCDEGMTCARCQGQSQKGQLYFFSCDRSKLPDFVHDFLPPSMTLMHQKQSIEDTVSEQVLSWDSENGRDVYLSSGYGPPLVWRLYEFKPKTQELLSQLQFYQDPHTGQSRSRFKYSPPFGLLKLDTSDDAHFETYLDTLLDPENLWDFGWSCYEEESQVDSEMFQAQLLDFMCKLYLNTGEHSLKVLLKDILRMMIITFIMGHTLTIVEGTLPTVLSYVRHSQRPSSVMKHTSPRLANRQLKFFFAILRNNIYEKILKWQQQTLHTAGKKDQTWLQAFCVMLGFAMVLEEVQRTILIQADAASQKGEMSAEGAEVQARNACERIDERFKLLIGLFQCKYRDRKWTNGSFGPATPEMREPVQVEFLGSLRALVESRYDHLRSRENVTFSHENQCLYTTRLTARFLLPFLGLPP